MTTARKQIRLSIPVSASEKAMAKKLVKDQVDGAKNVTQLVRKLLAERFKRHLEETRKTGARPRGRARQKQNPSPSVSPAV